MLGNVSTMANLAFCCQMSKKYCCSVKGSYCCSVKENCAHKKLLGILCCTLCHDSGTPVLYSK